MGRLRTETRVHAELELIHQLAPQVEHRQELVAQRDALQQQITALSDDIANQLALADQKAMRVGPYHLTLVENPGRITLDKHRLVELGVAPEVITEASVRGKPSVSLQVRKVSTDAGVG